MERLHAIGHVDRPNEHVLALGTTKDFYKNCQTSTDGRAVLKSAINLTKLVNGYYRGGGKSWNEWESRNLTTFQKLQLLQRALPQQLAIPIAVPKEAAVAVPKEAAVAVPIATALFAQPAAEAAAAELQLPDGGRQAMEQSCCAPMLKQSTYDTLKEQWQTQRMKQLERELSEAKATISREQLTIEGLREQVRLPPSTCTLAHSVTERVRDRFSCTCRLPVRQLRPPPTLLKRYYGKLKQMPVKKLKRLPVRKCRAPAALLKKYYRKMKELTRQKCRGLQKLTVRHLLWRMSW